MSARIDKTSECRQFTSRKVHFSIGSINCLIREEDPRKRVQITPTYLQGEATFYLDDYGKKESTTQKSA
jgi:hypothetical protein